MTSLIGKVVIVTVNSLEYAIDIKKVISIERMPEICKVHYVQDYITGLMIFRGYVVPVVSLRAWFGLREMDTQSQYAKKQRRVVIIEEAGKKIGLAVDAATNVVDINEASIQRVDHTLAKNQPSLVINLNNRLLTFLDIEKIMDAA